ncbi:MAG: vitamin B12 transporter, partial [Parvibaculaceae bacterium]
MTFVKYGLLISASAFALTSTAIAADSETTSTIKLDEIVVTATKTETPIEQVGSSVSVITAAEIEERQYQFALDVLRAMPGVQISQNGAFGGTASIRIRGAASGQTMVLIDGVEVNDPAGTSNSFNFANLDVYSIERIEVLRGPQSTLYGSDALGGVVSITTKRGKGPLTFSGFAETGSYGTSRFGGTAAGSDEKVDYRLSLSTVRSSGISKYDENLGGDEADSYENQIFSAAAGIDILSNLRAQGSFQYALSENEFDNSTSDSYDSFGENREITASGKIDWSVFNGVLLNTFEAGYSKINRDSHSGGFVSPFMGKRTNFSYQATVTPHDFVTLVGGAETEKTETGTGYSGTTNSFYGQAQVVPFEGLSLVGGLRHDNHDLTGTANTMRFTGAYHLDTTGTTFRASWGEGFKTPTPFQLTACYTGYGCLTGPNEDLLPEESIGWDAGIEQRLLDDRLSVEVNYFNQRIRNQIDYQGGRYENLDRVKSKGWEVITTARPLDWVEVSANYTFQDTHEN